MKKFGLLVIIILLTGYLDVYSQLLNPGFEIETGTIITDWIDNGSGTESVGTINARTGTNALSYITSSITNQDMRSVSTLPVPDNWYIHIIGWAIGNNANSRASVGTVMGTLNTSTSITTIGTTLTRLTYSGQNTQGSTQNALAKINSRSVSGSVTLYWDDIVIYTSSSSLVDLTVPNFSSTITASSNANGTSITLNWIDGTDANSGIRGVIILRSEGLAQLPPSLNDQGKYSVSGGNSGPNTIGLWSVVGIVNPGVQTFIDNSVSPNADYTYAVYMRDDAYNYSTASTSSITALPVELSSFSASIISSTVKLNWQTATEVNNYGFDVERKILKQVQNDNASWEKIGFINGNGNSNSPKSYSYEDKNVTAGKYYYRLKQIDNDGQFEYSKAIEVDFGTLKKFELSQNYPNPFNPKTSISYNLSEASNVRLTIFNLLGQELRTLVNEFKESGVHTINFDASDLNSGMYLYKIEAGSFVQTRKMTLVK